MRDKDKQDRQETAKTEPMGDKDKEKNFRETGKKTSNKIRDVREKGHARKIRDS